MNYKNNVERKLRVNKINQFYKSVLQLPSHTPTPLQLQPPLLHHLHKAVASLLQLQLPTHQHLQLLFQPLQLHLHLQQPLDLLLAIAPCLSQWMRSGLSLRFRCVKDCAAQPATPFQKIFNLSLETGRVPALWKTCLVPVLKVGLPAEINNYRPVALTLHIIKTLE